MTIIRIGPIDYEVVEINDLRDGDRKLDGWIHYHSGQIRIEASMSSQAKRQVIWHEIIHGLLDQMGGMPDQEHVETFCDAMAYGVMGVLRDNPWLAGEL